MTATAVPPEVAAALAGRPAVGQLDQAFPLLTADPTGLVDVCLLSRTEVEPLPDAVRVVVASTKARRNLTATGRATLLAVCDDAAHYLGLELRRSVEADGALAAELAVVRALRDDVGVELHPLRFRVDARLEVAERWDRSAALLARLGGTERVP